jgi:hypothetical protein
MDNIPLACTLNETDLVQRQQELQTLRQLILEKQLLPNGFALQFEGSTENLLAIAQVIAQERLCCRFLQFQLIAEPNMGSLRLEVTGENDAAEFLLTMFGLNEAGCESACLSSQC